MGGRTTTSSSLVVQLYAIATTLLMSSVSNSTAHCHKIASPRKLHLLRGGGPIDVPPAASLSPHPHAQPSAQPVGAERQPEIITNSAMGSTTSNSMPWETPEANNQHKNFRFAFSMLPRGSGVPPPGPGLSSNRIADPMTTPPPVAGP